MNYIKQSVHIVTQAKGGVGKSTIASLLYQFLQSHGETIGFDADPLSNSFIDVKGIEVIKVEADKNAHSTRYYDPMIESIIDNKDVLFVIDNGSSTHVSLLQYMQDSDIVNLLAENKRPVIMHIPLSGGKEFADCLDELVKVVKVFPMVKFVIWENNFINPIELAYRQEANYKAIEHAVLGTMSLRSLNNTPLLEDVNIMNKLNLSFASVLGDTEKLFSFAAKRRLQLYKDELFAQLQAILDA